MQTLHTGQDPEPAYRLAMSEIKGKGLNTSKWRRGEGRVFGREGREREVEGREDVEGREGEERWKGGKGRGREEVEREEREGEGRKKREKGRNGEKGRREKGRDN